MPTPLNPRKLSKFSPFTPKKSTPKGYQEIHVLLLSWLADDIGVSAQLDLLARVFSSVYNATSIASCLIPSTESEEFVRGVVTGFLERWDGGCVGGGGGEVCLNPGGEDRDGDKDGDEGRGKLRKKRPDKMGSEGKMKSGKGVDTKRLLLIYYSGHGEVSKKEGGGLDWCAYKKQPTDKEDPPSLPWTPIQKQLEFTHSDTLLILDACSSASSLSFSPSASSSQVKNQQPQSPHHPSQRSTFTLLTSCCFSTQAPGMGPDSFFNFFVQELCSLPLVKKSMREGGFEIEELHRRLVTRAGRGGEGARCPVLVRISSFFGEGVNGDGSGSGRGIVLGRLEDERVGREKNEGVGCYLGAAREILGVLEERFSKGDGDCGGVDGEGQGGCSGPREQDGKESEREGCEGRKRDSVDCCGVKNCQVVNCESEGESRRVSAVGEGVVRLDRSERESEDTLRPLVRC